MKLTCVTAVFNAIKSGNRERLIRCVKSVAALPIEHEHLIYDGASMDGTVELLRELVGCGKMPHLRVVSEPDTGIYNALNKGVRDAQGEWFYVLGCDDAIVRPEMMVRAIELGERKKADIVSSPVTTSEDFKQLFSPRRARILSGCSYPHQGMLARTALVRQLNGFDEQYRIAGDYDQQLRALFVGAKIVFSPDVYAFYYNDGISASPDFSAQYGECERLIAANLNLSRQEARDLFHRQFAPLRLIVRMATHSHPELRRAAAYLALRYALRKVNLLKENGALRWH